MPIPFRDLRDEEDLGIAGYLRFTSEDTGRGVRGALFLVNVRGEPIDFTFSRVDVSPSFLWRAGDAKRHAVAGLAAALFRACPKVPVVLLALSEEVHPLLFVEDLRVDVPLCRVTEGDIVSHSGGETRETLSNTLHLFWVGRTPPDDSPARRLLDALQARQLILEPFERAIQGLEEAFRG